MVGGWSWSISGRSRPTQVTRGAVGSPFTLNRDGKKRLPVASRLNHVGPSRAHFPSKAEFFDPHRPCSQAPIRKAPPQVREPASPASCLVQGTHLGKGPVARVWLT